VELAAVTVAVAEPPGPRHPKETLGLDLRRRRLHSRSASRRGGARGAAIAAICRAASAGAPVAKAEFVESDGLFAVAVASLPLPPSPVAESAPSSEPGMRGTVTVSAIAGEIAASPMTATDNNSLAFIVSSPQASGDDGDHAPVGRALSPFFDKRLGRNRNRRLCRRYFPSLYDAVTISAPPVRVSFPSRALEPRAAFAANA
jgi:hypothetical protein